MEQADLHRNFGRQHTYKTLGYTKAEETSTIRILLWLQNKGHMVQQNESVYDTAWVSYHHKPSSNVLLYQQQDDCLS